MVERKLKRISVRVPASWIRLLNERNVPISMTCRAALYQQLNATDPNLNEIGSKLRSKQRAASIFHQLKPTIVRTLTPDQAQNLTMQVVKLPTFRLILMKNCDPAELALLAEFLAQTNFAEEVLQDMYL